MQKENTSIFSVVTIHYMHCTYVRVCVCVCVLNIPPNVLDGQGVSRRRRRCKVYATISCTATTFSCDDVDDHSRVVLSVPDDSGSDYINASYIDVSVKLCECYSPPSMQKQLFLQTQSRMYVAVCYKCAHLLYLCHL